MWFSSPLWADVLQPVASSSSPSTASAWSPETACSILNARLSANRAVSDEEWLFRAHCIHLTNRINDEPTFGDGHVEMSTHIVHADGDRLTVAFKQQHNFAWENEQQNEDESSSSVELRVERLAGYPSVCPSVEMFGLVDQPSWNRSDSSDSSPLVDLYLQCRASLSRLWGVIETLRCLESPLFRFHDWRPADELQDDDELLGCIRISLTLTDSSVEVILWFDVSAPNDYPRRVECPDDPDLLLRFDSDGWNPDDPLDVNISRFFADVES